MAVVTVANLKGGAGKSTVTALLSLALMELGYDVLARDNDPQAGLTMLLLTRDVDLEPEDFFRPHVAPVVEVVSAPRVLLLSPSTIKSYKLIVGEGYPPAEELEDSLRRLAGSLGRGKIVFVDSPPEPTPPAIAALRVADALVLPVDRSPASLRGAALTLYAAREAGARPRAVFIVLNKLSRRERRVAERLKVETGHLLEQAARLGVEVRVLQPPLPRAVAIEDASVAGDRSIMEVYRRDTRVREAALGLARSLARELGRLGLVAAEAAVAQR